MLPGPGAQCPGRICTPDLPGLGVPELSGSGTQCYLVKGVPLLPGLGTPGYAAEGTQSLLDSGIPARSSMSSDRYTGLILFRLTGGIPTDPESKVYQRDRLGIP